MSDLSGCDKAEYVGAFPVRQDITVLPADDPKEIRLGWKIYEYCGTELLRPEDYAKIEALKNDPANYEKSGEITMYIGEEYHEKYRLTKFDDIQIGDTVICWGIPMKVEETDEEKQSAFARNASGCCLEFNKDERKCWVAQTVIASSILDRECPTEI